MQSFVIPAGEFTFRDLCKANPSALPLNLLKFVTQQVTQGKLARNRTAAPKVKAVSYVAI